MDLGGYAGDFHRHHTDMDIKNRSPLSKKELYRMMLANDRLKEITMTLREIDPERNGYVTQQELDDIFRSNYEEQMRGKHMFGLI